MNRGTPTRIPLPDYDLWLFDLATDQARPFTQGFGNVLGHSGSPNGTTIAFIRTRTEGFRFGDLWWTDVRTGEAQLLALGDFAWPEWSPDGVFAGATQQVTAKIDTSPADLWLSQSGVRTMHMSTTALPADTVGRVRTVTGVAWAEDLRYTNGTVESAGGRLVNYAFGYDTSTGRGGPEALAAGSPPGDGEVIVDRVAARDLGVEVGDTVSELGERFRVSGLLSGGTNIVNTTVYLSTEERRMVQDMATDLMAIIGFLIALAVIALTLFTVTLSKLRDYGIVKALGGTGQGIAKVVLLRALWTVAVAAATAIVVSVLVGAALDRITDNVHLAIQRSSILRVVSGAGLAGVIASLVPLRRVLSLDPATVFRRP